MQRVRWRQGFELAWLSSNLSRIAFTCIHPFSVTVQKSYLNSFGATCAVTQQTLYSILCAGPGAAAAAAGAPAGAAGAAGVGAGPGAAQYHLNPA